MVTRTTGAARLPAARPHPTSPPPVSPTSTLAPGTGDAATAIPVRLGLPSQHVQATVVPIGVTAQRGLEPPADPAVIGWYSGSALPGDSTGRTLLTGHLDTVTDGPGAFAALLQVKTGDPVQVTGSDGTSRTYRVTGRTTYAKATLPAAALTTDGPAGLTLITCGGPFDASTHHYRDNVVVTAAPV